MVPGNALWAMKVNADQVWNKALGEQGSIVREAWNASKGMLAMQTAEFGEMGEVARQILNDPAALGVDLKQGIVLSVGGEITDIYAEEGVAQIYLVALLENSDAFLKVADAAVAVANAEGGLSVYKDVEESGYTHYVIMSEDGISMDLGVSAESAVLRFMYNETVDAAALAQSLTAAFVQDSAPAESLQAFYENKADLSMWGDLEGVMTAYMPFIEEIDPSAAAQMQSYMHMYEGASCMIDVNFEDGKSVIGLHSYGSDEMEEYAQKYNTESSDKFFDRVPATSFAVANVAIKNFAGLVDELCKMSPQYAEVFALLEEEYDLTKEVIEGFPGIITVAFDAKDLGEADVPRFVVFAECDESVWEYVQGFLFEELEYYVHFGYEDGVMYVMDAQTYADGRGKDTFEDTKFAKDIENGGAVIDLTTLPKDVLDDLAWEFDYYMTGDELLEYVNSVVIVNSSDFTSATVTVNMGDKQHNLLEKVVLEAVMSAF